MQKAACEALARLKCPKDYPMKNLGIILLALSCCIVVSCKPARNNPSEQADKSARNDELNPKASPQVQKSDSSELLQYNLATLVGDYEKYGHTNAAWDASALQALRTFAEMRANKSWLSKSNAHKFEAAIAAARDAGCNDPLILYVQARYGKLPDGFTPQAHAERFTSAADALEKSHYADIRKFYATLRAAEAVKSAANRTNLPPTVDYYLQNSLTYLVSVLRDQSTPISEVNDACRDLFDAMGYNAKQQNDFYAAIEKPLFAGWPGTAVAYLVKGRYYIQYAWQARGHGWANTVTDKGWKSMAERLAIAEKSLNRAWEYDPTNESIAIEMINVELGQGNGRDRMEVWFNRAMNLNPASYLACQWKLNYLQPKWHGTAEDMLDFGRQCVNSDKWIGQVPLILVDAHAALAQNLDQSSRPSYWSQPVVWLDIKSSFEKFFQLNPEDIGWRHNYAKYAARCNQWEAFLQQAQLMGPINYEFFEGKDNYDFILKTAREKTKIGKR